MLILVSWMDFSPHEPGSLDLHVVECFSGISRIATFAARAGLASRALDITLDPDYGKPERRRSKRNGKKKRSFMDVNSEAGFVFLGSLLNIEAAFVSGGRAQGLKAKAMGLHHHERRLLNVAECFCFSVFILQHREQAHFAEGCPYTVGAGRLPSCQSWKYNDIKARDR